jgi:hypothetical protein
MFCPDVVSDACCGTFVQTNLDVADFGGILFTFTDGM